MPREKKKKAGAQEGWTFYGDAVKDAMASDDAVAVGAWLDEGNSADARHEIGRCKCAMPLVAAAAFEGSGQVSMPPSKTRTRGYATILQMVTNQCSQLTARAFSWVAPSPFESYPTHHMTHLMRAGPGPLNAIACLRVLTIMSFKSREVDFRLPQVVKLLVSKGVDVNACSSKAHGGLCAIKGAVCSNSPEILQLLLEHGAKDQPADDGPTAEDLAKMLALPADTAPPHSKGDSRCLDVLRRYKKGRREVERRQATSEEARGDARKAAAPDLTAAVAQPQPAAAAAARAADERDAKAAENPSVSPPPCPPPPSPHVTLAHVRCAERCMRRQSRRRNERSTASIAGAPDLASVFRSLVSS
jgi:hypothetical protein